MAEPMMINGINVIALKATIQNLQKQPSLGQSHFRAHNRRIDGGLNQSTIKDFFVAGQEDTSRTKPFILEADEPPVLLGENRAANPVEHLLHALASCLTTTMVYHAAVRGIKIEELESELEGDIDLRGFMGITNDVPKGFQNIRVTFKVKSDASPEKLKGLAEYSPVFNTVCQPVPVTVEVQKKETVEELVAV